MPWEKEKKENTNALTRTSPSRAGAVPLGQSVALEGRGGCVVRVEMGGRVQVWVFGFLVGGPGMSEGEGDGWVGG